MSELYKWTMDEWLRSALRCAYGVEDMDFSIYEHAMNSRPLEPIHDRFRWEIEHYQHLRAAGLLLTPAERDAWERLRTTVVWHDRSQVVKALADLPDRKEDPAP